MNKKILTVAIAAALAAPATVLAEVTVYGQLHMSMDYTDSNTAVPAGTVGNKGNVGISSNSSRIGFKGAEDLGGGLQAIWQVESQVNLDKANTTGTALTGTVAGGATGTIATNNSATGALANRDSFLGLSGGFGTVLFGKHDTPFKMFGRSLDPFADSIADTRQLLGNTQGYDDPGFDLRAPNAIAYITPSFSGFQAVGAFVTGFNQNYVGVDNNKYTAVSLNATYTNGPAYVGFAFEQHNIKDMAGAGGKNPTAFRLGGSYAFGPAKVGAEWEHISNADLNALGGAKRDGGTLFGTYGFGAETAKLALSTVSNWKVGGTSMTDTKSSLVALGLDHSFSKRTNAYVQYTKLLNKTNASYSLGGGGGYGDPLTPAVGGKPGALSLGLIHKF